MPTVTAAKTQSISQSDDPKQAILSAVGDLSKEIVLWDLVLIGTYIRPERTRGGIIKPMEVVKEDEFQGKSGLVLKLGEGVDNIFGLEEGKDWVAYSIKDGMACHVNGTACRLVPYERIRMKLSSPEMVF